MIIAPKTTITTTPVMTIAEVESKPFGIGVGEAVGFVVGFVVGGMYGVGAGVGVAVGVGIEAKSGILASNVADPLLPA